MSGRVECREWCRVRGPAADSLRRCPRVCSIRSTRTPGCVASTGPPTSSTSRVGCARGICRCVGCGRLRRRCAHCGDRRRLPHVRRVPDRRAAVARVAPARAPILGAPGDADRRAHVVAALGVLFVAGVTFWNARHASQHILINRDPGVYVNTGRWIALHGNLRVTWPWSVREPTRARLRFVRHVPARRDPELPVRAPAACTAGNGPRRRRRQADVRERARLRRLRASRLLRRRLAAPAATGRRAGRPRRVRASAAPTVVLRDTFSEIPMQVLLFTAVWIFADRRAFRRPRVALVAGLLLGMLQAAVSTPWSRCWVSRRCSR